METVSVKWQRWQQFLEHRRNKKLPKLEAPESYSDVPASVARPSHSGVRLNVRCLWKPSFDFFANSESHRLSSASTCHLQNVSILM
jgi:hypothetical protein